MSSICISLSYRFNLSQNLAVQIVAVITGGTYLFIVVAFLLWCQPLGDYLNPDYENISGQYGILSLLGLYSLCISTM